jgi:pyruvate kinase
LDENGGKRVKIISKIENREGLNNFEEILAVSDGIMVARGDLGVEIPVEAVPVAQKMIIKRCNEVGKVVITATQMLDSMIKNPRPTRAEVNDVANAILDGTDCVMLSGESAKGKYPVEAVKVMNNVAEKIDPMVSVQRNLSKRKVTITSAVAKGTADVSEELGAKVIAVATQSGRAVRDMRRYFPEATILGITNDEITANQMTILRGVKAYCDKTIENLEEFFELAERASVELELAQPGDIVVATCGEKIFQKGTTNSVKVIRVK